MTKCLKNTQIVEFIRTLLILSTVAVVRMIIKLEANKVFDVNQKK